MADVESLAERARRKRRELGLNPPPEPEVNKYAHLVPDVDDDRPPRSAADEELDRVLERISITEAYIRWCGKMTPVENGKRESVMISCPKPDHTDAHPSAWMNLDKGVWHCGTCNEGGDMYDIAAYHFGLPVPGYKGDEFPKLRERMAADLGYHVSRTIGGATRITAPVIEEETPEPEPEATVTSIEPDYDELWRDQDFTTIPYEEVIPDKTFLSEWMKIADQDDLPFAYYFWLGLQAVATAAGRNVYLDDYPRVFSNLYICLVGPSGWGKSRSYGILSELVREALPYDPEDPDSTGTLIENLPGSAEALIDLFSKPEYDSTDPKKIVGYKSVRGIVRSDEFSGLVNKSDRAGNNIKPTLMELYDAYGIVSARSRGHGASYAKDPFCQFISTVQPDVIHDLMKKSDTQSGFLNRWIFAMGEPRDRIRFRSHIDPTSCVDSLRDLRAWAGIERKLSFSSGAMERWNEYATNHLDPCMAETPGRPANPLLARIELLMKKIVLLLAINSRESVVSLNTVESAIKLHDYMGYSFGTVEQRIVSDDFDGCCEKIAADCKRIEGKTGKGARNHDFQYTQKKYGVKMFADALKTLVQIGSIEEYLDKPKRGPECTRYRYVRD